MEPDELTFGPLQLLVVGFPDLNHFTGRIAREMADLRGRGLIRVMDARMLSRHPDGSLTETYARTAGFEIEDLRRLTDEIPAGEHAAVVLVEHLWAGHVREGIRAANGLLLAQGMLTPEVMMIVGAEMQAKADAEAAIELAEAARGAALLDALATLKDAEHE